MWENACISTCFYTNLINPEITRFTVVVFFSCNIISFPFHSPSFGWLSASSFEVKMSLVCERGAFFSSPFAKCSYLCDCVCAYAFVYVYESACVCMYPCFMPFYLISIFMNAEIGFRNPLERMVVNILSVWVRGRVWILLSGIAPDTSHCSSREKSSNICFVHRLLLFLSQ